MAEDKVLMDDISELTEDEITDEKAQELLDEITEGTRIFTADGFGKVKIRFPTTAEKRKADIQYSMAFNEYLEMGLKTTREMEKILRDRGIWTDEDDAAITKKEKELEQKLLLLSKAKTKKRKREIREEIAAVREELLELNQQKQGFYANTVESKAEEVRLAYLMYTCTSDALTDKPLWNSFEEYNDEENQAGVIDIAYQFMTFLRGLPADFLSYLPEAMLDDEETEDKQDS